MIFKLPCDQEKRNGSPVLFLEQQSAGFTDIGKHLICVIKGIVMLQRFFQKGIAMAQGVLCGEIQSLLFKIEIPIQKCICFIQMLHIKTLVHDALGPLKIVVQLLGNGSNGAAAAQYMMG